MNHEDESHLKYKYIICKRCFNRFLFKFEKAYGSFIHKMKLITI